MHLHDNPNGHQQLWNFDFIDNFRDDISELSTESHLQPPLYQGNFLKGSWNIIKEDHEEHKREKLPLKRLSIFSNTNTNSRRGSIFINFLDNAKDGDPTTNHQWDLNCQEQENFNLLLGEGRKSHQIISTPKTENQKDHSLLSLKTQDKSPMKKKRRASKTKEESNCCNCKKSKCLRLYCVCFQNGGTCSKECSCNNCLNREEFKEVREFVIQKTKEINPLAFGHKYGVVKQKGKDKVLHTRGCRCKKIGCD